MFSSLLILGLMATTQSIALSSENEMTLRPDAEQKFNETRVSKGLLKFLTGYKLGSSHLGSNHLSSSGTLAASNSLRIFNKVLNSALSVSYGKVNEIEPLPAIEGSDIKYPTEYSGEVKPIVEDETETKDGHYITHVHASDTAVSHDDLTRLHNSLVDRANRNNKFLRISRQL